MANTLKRGVTGKNHLLRLITDKPLDSEIMILEKAIYYAFKMILENDPTGQSPLLYDGQPVVFKNGSQDLKELFKKIVNTYSTL